MKKTIQEDIKSVKNYYDTFSKKCENWPNKYNIKRQISKFLSDYTLLSKINLNNKSVLNIGCSEPIDEIFWVNIIKEWHSLDINKDIIEISKKMTEESLPENLNKKIKFILGDATKMELADGYYDIVTAFSTIEHIPGEKNREKAFKEIYRVLKKDGYLIITVPNKWDFRDYLESKRIRKLNISAPYEYNYSPIELKKILIHNNFKILASASTGFNPWSHIDRALKKLKLGNCVVYTGRRFGFLAQK